MGKFFGSRATPRFPNSEGRTFFDGPICLNPFAGQIKGSYLKIDKSIIISTYWPHLKLDKGVFFILPKYIYI